MRLFTAVSATATVLTILTILVALPAQAAEFTANLEAVATFDRRACPSLFTFKGTITAPSAGDVRYRFVRSDGATGPIVTLSFRTPGVHDVSTTWQLGGAGLTSYEGWERIEIVAPVSAHSNRARFTMLCFDKSGPVPAAP